MLSLTYTATGDNGGRRGCPAPIGRQRRTDGESGCGSARAQAAAVATVARGRSYHAAFYLKPLVELKVTLACASFAPAIALLYRALLRFAVAVAIAISSRSGVWTLSPCSAWRRRGAR
jgi:hypothetical protein